LPYFALRRAEAPQAGRKRFLLKKEAETFATGAAHRRCKMSNAGRGKQEKFFGAFFFKKEHFLHDAFVSNVKFAKPSQKWRGACQQPRLSTPPDPRAPFWQPGFQAWARHAPIRV
jgi:hypothetical protein